MEDISVLLMGLNEEENLPRLFASFKDIKDIVFIDHQSTDHSAEIAKSLGARVYIREFIHNIATQDDIDEFKKRYNYEPLFKVGEIIRHSGKERTEIQKLCKNNWILNIDCDEVVTWNLGKVKKILPKFDVINCKFYHERNSDGSRTDEWLQTTKLYRRDRTFWVGRVHEVLDGFNLKVGFSDDMEIDHYHRLREYNKGYINHLEYDLLHDNLVRSYYYLGVEYRHWQEWEKAIGVLTIYLKNTTFIPEKINAYLMIADCLWQLGREEEAWIYALRPLEFNPDDKKIYKQLVKMSPPRHRAGWQKHFDIAESDHVMGN